MHEIAMITDSQINAVANARANYEYNNSSHRKTERKFANMLPVMDSFLLGASTTGSLGTKVVSGGKELADWGIFIGLAHLYRKTINKIVNNSETLQNFKEDSPVAFNLANTALGVTVCCSGAYYIKKGYQKFIAPHISKDVKDAPQNLADKIDKSSIGKSINEGMKNFAKNYPKITNGLKIAAVWTLPIVCVGILATWITDMVKANNVKKTTQKELEGLRLAAAQQLAMQNSVQENDNNE